MDSYELLQDLDKKHGKKLDYSVTVSPDDISKITKSVSKDRTENAKKIIADILNAKDKEASTQAPVGLQVEEIVVDDSEKTINENDKNDNER